MVTSATSEGGCGNGLARVSTSIASLSSRAEPELLSRWVSITLPERSSLNDTATTPSSPLLRASCGYFLCLLRCSTSDLCQVRVASEGFEEMPCLGAAGFSAGGASTGGGAVVSLGAAEVCGVACCSGRGSSSCSLTSTSSIGTCFSTTTSGSGASGASSTFGISMSVFSLTSSIGATDGAASSARSPIATLSFSAGGATAIGAISIMNAPR